MAAFDPLRTFARELSCTMDSSPPASARTMPKAVVIRVSGSIALLAATTAFAISAYWEPYFGNAVAYIALPLIVALLTWAIVWLARLMIVGLLPADSEHLIPAMLKRWIRSWLLLRFGLFGGVLLLLVAIVVAAIAGVWTSPLIEALFYVVTLQILLDLMFNTVLNVGIIRRRPRRC